MRIYSKNLIWILKKQTTELRLKKNIFKSKFWLKKKCSCFHENCNWLKVESQFLTKMSWLLLQRYRQFFSSFATFSQVFNGNADKDTIVNHVLIQPIMARSVQIKPKSWNGHISMRAEFYGCILSGNVWGSLFDRQDSPKTQLVNARLTYSHKVTVSLFRGGLQ